jgi:NitT/TauT family transport system permease protein
MQPESSNNQTGQNSSTQDKPLDDFGQLSAGLDALETGGGVGQNRARALLRSFAPLIAVVASLVIWQLLYLLRFQPDYILPSPAQVFASLANQATEGQLWEAIFNSLRRGFQGFVLALIIATPIGLALGLNKTLQLIFRPILTGLQQLPSVAWVPAAIIWFGLSDATIFAVILLGAVPSIANGLISGIEQIQPLLLRAGKVLGARGFASIRHVVIPAAWPGYLSGLEQGWAFAWRSLMAAELIAISPAIGPGLGQLLNVGRELGDMSLVMGSILVILAVGVLIERAFFAPMRQRTLVNRGLVRA